MTKEQRVQKYSRGCESPKRLRNAMNHREMDIAQSLWDSSILGAIC